MKETVGIVIVNYNGAAYQNDCIRSLYQMSCQDFEIIVVDSASTDNSIELLKKEFPEVHILCQKENVGVAKGNNIGINYSIKLNMEYTLLLNNDVEVEHDMLRYLLQETGINQIIVPKMYYYKPNNMLWYAGGKINWKKGDSEHFGCNQKEEDDSYNHKAIVTYAPTCCMLIHNSLFQKIGMIDENYFMYYDDTDFCARILKTGVQIKYVPKAVLWHKVSSSTGGTNTKIATYYLNRNRLYFLDKYKKDIGSFTKQYVVVRYWMKYLLSFFYHKNNRILPEAYRDYKNKKMGRKDF